METLYWIRKKMAINFLNFKRILYSRAPHLAPQPVGVRGSVYLSVGDCSLGSQPVATAIS